MKLIQGDTSSGGARFIKFENPHHHQDGREQRVARSQLDNNNESNDEDDDDTRSDSGTSPRDLHRLNELVGSSFDIPPDDEVKKKAKKRKKKTNPGSFCFAISSIIVALSGLSLSSLFASSFPSLLRSPGANLPRYAATCRAPARKTLGRYRARSQRAVRTNRCCWGCCRMGRDHERE